jgi:hypothetical protein
LRWRVNTNNINTIPIPIPNGIGIGGIGIVTSLVLLKISKEEESAYHIDRCIKSGLLIQVSKDVE